MYHRLWEKKHTTQRQIVPSDQQTIQNSERIQCKA
jgi:hypothetical protein